MWVAPSLVSVITIKAIHLQKSRKEHTMFATIGLFLQLLYFILLARILLSWLPGFRNNPVAGLIYDITEPILAPARRLIPPMGGLDISPIIVFLLLGALQRMVMGLG